MTSLSEWVRGFCKATGLRLNTDLGQHFLIDDVVLNAIIEAANLQKDERVIEIGPGIGVLTARLLEAHTNVTAIEIDNRLIPMLRAYVANTVPDVPSNRLTVVQGNALQVDLPTEPYKIVANIPYHITSPLLRHVFRESPVYPSSLTLLIQREVAENIVNVKDAGMLTILVALFGTPRIVCMVPPKCFLPPPQVDSAVLHIDCFDKPKAPPETIDRIFQLTKLAFGQKRKMLRNTIGSLPDGLERMEKAGIAIDRRPQTLTIEEWITLANT